MQSARIVADSVSPGGARLVTVEVRLPRAVLAELNTHRDLSRNSASSRAIPMRRTLALVASDPWIPDEWPRNGPGMSPEGVLEGEDAARAERAWRGACEAAVRWAKELALCGVHKEIANRILEPFMWHTVLITATEWDNFLHLRCHPSASRPLRLAAETIRDAIAGSTPRLLQPGEWHLPLIQPGERSEIPAEDLIPVSVGRCARVSYLTHRGERDPAADVALHDRLLASGHMSPFEHVATPAEDPEERSGNFRGWRQYRKSLPREWDPLGPGRESA